MKTVLIVISLMAVAAAAGASFLLQAGAQEPPPIAAELSISCDTDVVPRNIDTVLSCTYSATNTGTQSIITPMLVFVPSAQVPAPDRYFFFGYRREGVDLATTGSEVTYRFNTIAPGRSSNVTLEIIVRASGRFGAEVQLVDAYGNRLDSETMAREVVDASIAPTASLKLRRLVVEPEGAPDWAPYQVMLTNLSDATATGASVRVHPGSGATVENAAFARNGETGTFIHDFGDMSSMLGLGEVANLRAVNSDCLSAAPAAVARLQFGREEVRVAALADSPFGCGSAGITNVAPRGLPAGGVGPDATTVESTLSLVAMLFGVAGFAAVGLAIFIVR